MTTSDRDPQIWRMARARAKFKSHALTYLLVNALLWTIWAVTSRQTGDYGVPWPIWPTVFWGIGLGIQGLATYGRFGQENWSEREYERLMRERQAGRL
ncbi:2TM domain-containing protein [Solirubrum puertoriconensis]|uniref:2TM domain-containing protein n=1 Tax=Solirubrum puertoriconensis TaxID=1751427 RepID=A0A9X0HNW9_SOLP1|nr:2TM domain-containing protein [Solirubrum puertoriconensis]KUG09430.1 hypothetical protein ASU33_17025 [Solirubrum puertoriconensis]